MLPLNGKQILLIHFLNHPGILLGFAPPTQRMASTLLRWPIGCQLINIFAISSTCFKAAEMSALHFAASVRPAPNMSLLTYPLRMTNGTVTLTRFSWISVTRARAGLQIPLASSKIIIALNRAKVSHIQASHENSLSESGWHLPFRNRSQTLANAMSFPDDFGRSSNTLVWYFFARMPM